MSVAAFRSTRTNPGNIGGRPVNPEITHLEGAVESIVALTDDAELLDRGAKMLHVLTARLNHETQAQVVNLGHIRRISAAMSKLSSTMLERSSRLRDAVLPEVRRCYAIAEAHYSGVRR